MAMDEPLLDTAMGDPVASKHGGGDSEPTPHSGTGFWLTWFTILCTMAGTGVLQLPYALQQGGWLCVALIVVIAGMTNYTGRILIKSLYLGPAGQRISNYPALGRLACGRLGIVLVQIFHKATLLGVTTLFLILAGKFLMAALGGSGEGLIFNSTDSAKWGPIWTLVAGGCVFVPVLSFYTIKEAVALSAFGAMATASCVVVVIVFSVILSPLTIDTEAEVGNLTGTGCSANNSEACPWNQHELVNWALFPSAFASITLSFGGHAVFPSIEGHMARRHHFGRTFNAAYVAMVVLYVGISSVCYDVFGNATMSPILSNMPLGTTPMGYITKVMNLLIACQVMSAYPILNNVVSLEFEDVCGISNPNRTKGARVALRLLMRSCIVACTVVVAIYIPYFADFMTLIGALCLTMIVFILPVIFHWILRDRATAAGGAPPLHVLEKVWGVFVVIVGAAGGAIGSYQATRAIVEKLLEAHA